MKSIILAALMVTAALSAGGCGTPKAPSPSPAASSAAVPAVHQINEESQQIYRKAVTAYGKEIISMPWNLPIRLWRKTAKITKPFL